MSSAALVQCTISGNHAPNGSAIAAVCGSRSDVENSIVAFNTGGSAYHDAGSVPDFSCSDIYGNEGGDWVGAIADQAGINGNLNLDPLFCHPEGGDFTLRDDSPCRGHSPQSPDCDRMGAWPVGCATSMVDGGPLGGGADLLFAPNPSSGSCHILLRNAGRGEVRLSIFGAGGRLVWEWVRDSGLSGGCELFWDGLDSDGKPVASGIYLSRMESANKVAKGRVVITR